MEKELITINHAFVGEAAAVTIVMAIWLIVVSAGPFAAEVYQLESND